MRCIAHSELLGLEELRKIGNVMYLVNDTITPCANTGELVIDYSTDGKWELLLHTTLDDGAGNSCAVAKVDTLIDHQEVYWGGIIPEGQLAKGEKKWYGSIRLLNCRDLEGSGWVGEVIIAFSDRKEWQDVMYIAGLLQVLKDILKMDFDLPDGIMNDPVWGTAINITRPLLERYKRILSK